MQEQLNLFLGIFQRLRDAGIKTAVINGYEPVTHKIGRDVDILINPRDLGAIVAECRSVASAQDWPYVSGRWVGHWLPKGLYQLVFHKPTGGGFLYLALDLICTQGVAAGLVTAYSYNRLNHGTLSGSDVQICPVASYMKKFLQVLAGHNESIGWVEGLKVVPQAVSEEVTFLLGPRFASRYTRSVKGRRLQAAWRPLRRHAQIAHALRWPAASVRNVVASVMRKVLGSWVVRVPTIAVVGPDGVGKSSALERAESYLSDCFITLRRRHWRPRLFPNLRDLLRPGLGSSGALLPSADGDDMTSGVAPRRAPGKFGFVRLVYYWLDYVIGGWFRDRRYACSDILINLYDRCSLDLFVDPLRFGLRPQASHPRAVELFPKPDLVILLMATTSEIHSRKKELTPGEIERQLELWQECHSAGYVHRAISVGDKSPHQVGSAIAHAILEWLSSRPIRR
jgi:hypothetical protein